MPNLNMPILTSLKIIEEIDDILKVQCADGNWNYNSYMHGLANGMILIKSIVTGNEPKFLNPPKRWLSKGNNDANI